jgi:hypothetical protein
MNDTLSVSAPVALVLTWAMHIAQRVLFYFNPHTLVALLITYTDMWMCWIMFEPPPNTNLLGVLFPAAVTEFIVVVSLCFGIIPFSFTPYDMIREESKAHTVTWFLYMITDMLMIFRTIIIFRDCQLPKRQRHDRQE